MPHALKAIYRNGTFILQTSCDLPEGAEVELLIQSPQVVSPPIADPATKQRFLQAKIYADAAESYSTQCSEFNAGNAA